jgi:hypothetical protein
MEHPDAAASIGAVVHRLADTIGLTPAGLRENGWQIVADELASKRASKPVAEPKKRRLRAVPGGGE